MKTKYNIGDTVWYAQRKTVERQEMCPDCFGQRALTVIKGDGSQVSIHCCGCSSGFELPKGYVNYYAQVTDVSKITIQRIEVIESEVTYGHNKSYRSEESDLFDTKEEAEVRALELSEKHNQEQLSRIYQKEKHNRTWAWNAHYHRDCVKRAEKDLVYHLAQLSVAKVKTKEEKANQ